VNTPNYESDFLLKILRALFADNRLPMSTTPKGGESITSMSQPGSRSVATIIPKLTIPRHGGRNTDFSDSW
jgi:hypothetical protein